MKKSGGTIFHFHCFLGAFASRRLWTTAKEAQLTVWGMLLGYVWDRNARWYQADGTRRTVPTSLLTSSWWLDYCQIFVCQHNQFLSFKTHFWSFKEEGPDDAPFVHHQGSREGTVHLEKGFINLGLKQSGFKILIWFRNHVKPWLILGSDGLFEYLTQVL